MNDVHLRTFDLNLLVTLDAVLREGSVQRAAVRLGVTQSAVSHALRRLREATGDELLVRTPSGMVPTARAAKLGTVLRGALDEIELGLRGDAEFDPRTAARAFTLSSADYTELVLAPLLARRFATSAPSVDLIFRSPVDDVQDELESGRVDLALGVFHGALAGCKQRALFRDRFVCVVRRDHPAARRGLTMERYLSLDHVAIAPRRTGSSTVVDASLTKLGLRRRVRMVVPHFMVAPILVAESDMVLTSPERIARRYRGMLPVKIVDVPFEVPGFTISQVWHERQDREAGHVWLRQALAALC